MRLVTLLGMLFGLLWVSGCATEADSNMPWNTPQSWEGTPGIPGFTPSDR